MKRIAQAITLGVVCWIASCGSGNNNSSGALAFAPQTLRVEDVSGATVYMNITEEDIKDGVEEHGFNMFRLMLRRFDLYTSSSSSISPTALISPSRLLRIHDVVDQVVSRGASIIVDIHEFPGLCRWTCAKVDFSIWDLTEGLNERQLLANTWEQLAHEFRSYSPQEVVFEILNEPEPLITGVDGSGNFIFGGLLRTWYDLQDDIIKRIRKIDPNRTIIVSPPDSWRITSLEEWPVSITIQNDGNVWVTAHMYHPHDFTHQLGPGTKKGYPGIFNGVLWPSQWWDRDKLKEVMGSVEWFQSIYNLPIIITEFSCVKDAPGCDQWLEDVTDIFRDLGLGWTYHVFREGDTNLYWDLESPPYNRLAIIRKAIRR